MATKTKKQIAEEKIPPYMERHLQTLKMNVAEYLNFCKQNGFRRIMQKGHGELEQEILVVRRAVADERMRVLKIRRPELIINKWLDEYGVNCSNINSNNFASSKEFTKNLPELPSNVSILSQVLNTAAVNKCLPATKRMIRHVYEVSPDCLFELTHGQKRMIEALPQLAYFEDFFVRPVTDWQPKSHNSSRQFASLLRHLFAKYTIPKFMDQVWFTQGVGHRSQFWYAHLGTGQNIRTADGLPCSLTKKQAHYFCQAPDNYNVDGALRYGQICSYGGNVRLANAFLPTLVCQETSFYHDEFWQSVIRWFIENPMLDLAHVGPVVDWLNHQKYVPRTIYNEPGRPTTIPPAQPHLSMKKRDPEATLRAVEAWHKELGKAKKSGFIQWKSSNFPSFDFIEGKGNNEKRWQITELLDSKQLQAEGKAMSHCVGSYSHSCSSGRVSIWSMTCKKITGVERELTVEVVNANKEIVQARAKYNKKSTTQQQNIMARWCQQAGLHMSPYLL